MLQPFKLWLYDTRRWLTIGTPDDEEQSPIYLNNDSQSGTQIKPSGCFFRRRRRNVHVGGFTYTL